MTTTPFLQQVACDLIAKYDDNLRHITVVVPSQRAHKFLLSYLSKELKKTFIAPKIITIDEFMTSVSGLKTIDNMQLLLEMFILNKEFNPLGDNDMIKFSGWAQQFLGDINDIDMHLVDAKSLFTTIADVKELALFGVPEIERTARQIAWLQFFKNLYSFYDQFNISLLQRHCGYQGMIFRFVADHIHEIVGDLKNDKFVFCGFNALTESEKKIFGVLIHEQIAEVYWDADTYYLNNPMRDAGKFLRDNFKELKISNPTFIGNYFNESSKEITVVSAQNNIAQAKYAGELLTNMSAEELNNTVIVPADESLLVPLLNSISIPEINITMGLPVSQTHLYNLFILMFEMQQNVHRTAVLKSRNKNKIYVKDVLAILGHVYCVEFCRQRGVNSDNLLEDIQRSKRVFYTLEELLEFPNILLISDFANEAFLIWNSSTDAVSSMKRLIELIASSVLENENATEKTPDKQIFSNSYYSLLKVFDRLAEACSLYGEVIDVANLYFLFESEAKKETLSFKGDAKNGLQIMGVLETRTLDFENVIFLSVNEGVLPSGKTINSLIPFDVKRHFHLPSYQYKDAVFSYHFSRLIQRAKNVHILYNSSLADGKSECSRFVNQLVYELPKENPNVVIRQKTIRVEADILSDFPIVIVKDEQVMKAIRAISQFSPSSLSKYINCPLQFYFTKVQRIKVLDELLDSADDSTLGNVVHGVMEEIYTPQINSVIQINPAIFKKIDSLVDAHFGNSTNKVVLSKEDLQHGKNLLVREIALRYIENILKADQQSEFPMTLRFLEKELTFTMTLDEGVAKIFGTADRIDEYADGTTRIIDYKTGNVDPKSLIVKELNELFTKSTNGKAFQLMMYALMYRKSISDKKPVCSGIFSTRNSKTPFTPLIVDGSEIIADDAIEEFEKGLKLMLEEIFNPDIDFVQTPNLINCSYCDYKTICNR